MFFSLLLEPICPATLKKKKKKTWNHPWSQGSYHGAQPQTLNKHLKERRTDQSLRLWFKIDVRKITWLRGAQNRVNLSAVLQVISQMWWHLHDFRKKKKKSLVISQNAFLFCWPSLTMYVYAQVSIKLFDNINLIQ